MTPLISLIIPLYNNGKYLGKCLNSVLSQPFCDIEIIIIDDGSTDNGLEIAKEFEEKHPNIKAYHFENGGVSIARNRGIELATGKYIAFLDPDDVWVKDSLNDKLLNELNNSYDIIHCGFFTSDGKSIIKSDRATEKKTEFGSWDNIKEDKSHICSVFFNRTLIENYKIRFKEGCKMAEDYTFVGIACYCAESMSFIDNPIHIYWSDNTGSATHKAQNNFDRLYHSYSARMWEADEAISKKSYGAQADINVKDFCKTLAYGVVLEMLEEHFHNHSNVKAAIKELKRLNLYDVVINNAYGIDPYLEQKLLKFNSHPYLFMLKIRLRGILGKALKRIMPYKLVARIRLWYLKDR